MSDDAILVAHILDCIEAIEEFVAGGRETLFNSRMVRDATLRNLQTLAESTQRLSDALKDVHPEIEWHQIAGFRNVLTHGYLGIDLDLVWGIIEKDLPALRAALIPHSAEG